MVIPFVQGLGLNEQELEMRSILVRVQQVWQMSWGNVLETMSNEHCKCELAQELVKASVQNRSRQQATSTEEQTQVNTITHANDQNLTREVIFSQL